MSKYLPIYLNDHLMGATVGVELVRRIAKQYDGSELGRFASGLAEEIDADREALKDVMLALNASADRVKVAAGWASEKAGRLKLNGELRGSSPLSPLVELEGLSLGIEGKRSMWVALAEAPDVAGRIGPDRLQELITRAEDQRARVEHHRLQAVHQAL